MQYKNVFSFIETTWNEVLSIALYLWQGKTVGLLLAFIGSLHNEL